MGEKLQLMWRIWRSNSHVVIAIRRKGGKMTVYKNIEIERRDQVLDQTLDQLRTSITSIKEKK